MYRLNWGAQRYHPLTGHGFSGGLSDTILGTGPIAYWPQSEIPASQEYLTFNGSTTVVNCGSGASLDDLHDAAFTVEAWIKPESMGGASQGRIAAKTTATPGGWYFYTIATNRLAAVVRCATTDGYTYGTNAELSLDTWQHVAMCWDDASYARPIIWINGVQQSSGGGTDRGDAIVTDAASDLVIGADSVLARAYDGNMGWVRISNNIRYTAGGGSFTPPARTTIPTVDANTVGLWPMNEGYGTVAGDLSANNNDGTISNGDWGAYPAADNAEGTAARDGAYTGVTLGQSVSPFVCPLYDGVNDFTNIYSASLATAFSGAAGTAMIFAKVSGAGVWTDGKYGVLLKIKVDVNNQVLISKWNSNNQLTYQYKAGGTLLQTLKTSVSATGWINLCITWNKAGDKAICYYNGVQEGATMTGLGTWAGALSATETIVGATDTTPTNNWNGYLAHAAIWTKALTAVQILDIYNASGVA